MKIICKWVMVRCKECKERVPEQVTINGICEECFFKGDPP